MNRKYRLSMTINMIQQRVLLIMRSLICLLLGQIGACVKITSIYFLPLLCANKILCLLIGCTSYKSPITISRKPIIQNDTMIRSPKFNLTALGRDKAMGHMIHFLLCGVITMVKVVLNMIKRGKRAE